MKKIEWKVASEMASPMEWQGLKCYDDFLPIVRFEDLKCQPMCQPLKHKVRREMTACLTPVLAFAFFCLLVDLPFVSAQVGLGTPMKISIKEADDNLQVKTLKPDYPPEAKAKGIEGTVRLRVVINERGNVGTRGSCRVTRF
jgi:hypothetical protein